MSNTPKHVMERLATELIGLMKAIDGKVRRFAALGDAEFVGERLEAICALRRLVDIVKNLPCAAVEGRMNDAIREARAILKSFEKRERAHLTSLATAILMRQRLWTIDRAKRGYAQKAFDAWDELRQSRPSIQELRQAYTRMEEAIKEAEFDLPVEKRVKMTLSPAPAKTTTRRVDAQRESRRLERLAAQPKKGSKSESPDKDGQSKKSRQKKRQRERMATA